MDSFAGNVKIACAICNKIFASNQTRNRHVRKFHSIAIDQRKSHIKCPMCKTKDEFLGTFANLEVHLEKHHGEKMEKQIIKFVSQEDYKQWKVTEKLEVNYAVHRRKKGNLYTEVNYACNRSNLTGYSENYKKRTGKAAGSIKISGVCPSRYVIKFYENGEIIANIQRAHAGHREEIRSQHLSLEDKKIIVKKLEHGVTTDRVLEDARKDCKEKLNRMNLLNRKDVNYLIRKHNIDKRRHADEMVAVMLKVKEWNANGKNYAFLFKQLGERHAVLGDNDFAVAFMNSTMKHKLINFHNIICVDGTHGTNKRGLELTTILVKDDRNCGFPVAFFLSNRLDQQIQEIFLNALRSQINEEIKPTYFMSDDDPKYYNAWINAMGNRPRRLLCSWHVVKNWNIQGKAKIRDQEMKKNMKREMKQILNETDEKRFEKLYNAYFKKLEDADEVTFLNYLKKYYFINQERIHMWAHCFRKNAGINTNMAIESLNNFLKSNQLNRNTKVTIEKLLDNLEELVDIKMWHRILNIERPTAANYQDRVVISAHKKAENKMKNIDNTDKVIVEVGFGDFQVKSFTSNHSYNVSYNELCESECKKGFCRVCKICVHRYRCDCTEYVVKSTMCKHVHLVCMYEKRGGDNSVLDEVKYVEENQIANFHKEKVRQFIRERKEERQDINLTQETRESECQILMKFLQSLDEDTYKVVMGKYFTIKKEVEGKGPTTNRRKMEKQSYFPSKWHCT